jgi:hypothetical protein
MDLPIPRPRAIALDKFIIQRLGPRTKAIHPDTALWDHLIMDKHFSGGHDLRNPGYIIFFLPRAE